MHIISRGPFREAAKIYSTHASALDAAYLVLRDEDFATPDSLKVRFQSPDRMKYREKWWVIDVGGNQKGLITLSGCYFTF